MTEKEMFLSSWKREYETLVRVLKAFPEDKLDMKPSERSRSARELAWTFASEQVLLESALKGKVDFSKIPPTPATYDEIFVALEANRKRLVRKVQRLTSKQWNLKIPWMVAPGKVTKVRVADIAWVLLMDLVHHRGQFSVYLRLAGAKVPSIYGPTADEPWM
jgi:uncharacterized damage-inducible protein DinB